MQQVSAQDAQFLYMESGSNRTHVIMVQIFDASTAPDGGVRFEDIVAHVQSREHCSPIFRRKLQRVPLELDYPYWVDDEYYDIEYHIRQGVLSAPGDWQQLCTKLASYHCRPLDMSRPPWEMYVIEGLDAIDGLAKGAYAIATKIHHVAVDGASIINFFGVLGDKDTAGTPLLDLSGLKQEPAPRPSLKEMARRGWSNNLRSPGRLAKTLARSAPTLYQAIQHARNDSDPAANVPSTRFNADVSPHKVYGATFFPLPDFKRIRSLADGASLNDVVLAVCSGGLRRYLDHHSELPESPLVAWMPINRRLGSDATEMPGNNISAMTAPIHTDIADPVQRLQAIVESTTDSKEARSGVSARLMTDITREMPATAQVAASQLILNSGVAGATCNLFVSNVPGSQEPMYQNGATLVHTMGFAPLGQGMGLFIGTPSYNGEINFSVISTREIMPDINYFIECLEDAVAELLALCKSV